MSHTPKPWLVDDREAPLLVLSGAPTGLLIPRIIAKVFSRCRVEGEDEVTVVEEAEANAKLVAAAPELLEALRRSTALLEWESKYVIGGNMSDHERAIIIQLSKAAIKKATGQLNDGKLVFHVFDITGDR
jgi:hypothetical protein